MLEGHISKSFDGDLAGMHIRVLEMGGLALDQVRAAARAYAEWDSAQCPACHRPRGMCSALCGTRIYDDQLTLIARAIRWRAICGPSSRWRRLLPNWIGPVPRPARSPAPCCTRAAGPGRGTSSDARHLASLATSLLRLSLEALDQLDGELAEQVIDRDQDLDAEYAAGLRRLLTRALENPAQLEVTVEAAFALKALERIGDHARNISEQIAGMAAHVVRVTRTP